jgi:hypothetical protein
LSVKTPWQCLRRAVQESADAPGASPRRSAVVVSEPLLRPLGRQGVGSANGQGHGGAGSRPEDCFGSCTPNLQARQGPRLDRGLMTRPELPRLRLRASLLGVFSYRNPVGRISLISIISAGIRVGWRRVM